MSAENTPNPSAPATIRATLSLTDRVLLGQWLRSVRDELEGVGGGEQRYLRALHGCVVLEVL